MKNRKEKSNRLFFRFASIALSLCVATGWLAMPGILDASALDIPVFVAISAESFHSSALTSDGKVYSWGDNNYGQLGDGTTTQQTRPVCISNIPSSLLYGKTITAIRKGDDHTVAIDSTGKIYLWGRNTNGQLGDNTNNSQSSPICLSTIVGNPLYGKTVIKIHAAAFQTFVITSDGKLYSWGRNVNGLLGDLTSTPRRVPVCISDIVTNNLYGKTVSEVRAGNYHTMALTSDGKVYAWGNNEKGQLGNGLFDIAGTVNSNPICISNITTNLLYGKTVSAISAGYEHSMAVASGKVYAWGSNNLGQIGDNTNINKSSPVCISDINHANNKLYGKSVSQVDTGQYHTIAISDGKVYAWGLNSTGSLGDGTIVSKSLPVCISDIVSSNLYGKTVVSIATAREHSLALTSQGSVFSWGKNSYGQLGSNTAINAVEKLPVPLYLIVYNITWNANGGEGGTITSVSHGTIPDPPSGITRAGYTLTGWTPTIVAATEPVTYTAQWAATQTIVTVTKTTLGMTVNINGWTANNQYQIWSYRQITSDILLGDSSNVQANQWILSMPYAAGGSVTPEQDSSINFTIPDFVSPTENYLIAVRVADAGGNFVQEVRDAYTPEDVGKVVITKVLVDGVVTTGYELKEIEVGAQVLIKVIGNDAANKVYSAKQIAGNQEVDLDRINTNEFLWDISALEPGIYTIEVTITNGNSTATQNITFELFSSTANIDYGTIDDMILTWNTVAGTVTIAPDFANGTFSYRVREPGRAPIHRSVEHDVEESIPAYPLAAPGVYHVSGYVTRAGYIGTESGGFDDGIIRTLVIPRTGSGTATMNFTANPNQTEFTKGTPIVFTATSNLPGAQYSFWRYDATGYVLVKDWSSNNEFNWTPARIGEYTLEARAKGAGAGSYEIKKSLNVNITDTVDHKAAITGITINDVYLNSTAQAKKPIMIMANATAANGEDLLYKFYVYDNDMKNQQLKNYSVDQCCVWTPREAGTYTISVLVKNQHSFGKYDAIESFEIQVY